MSLCLLSRAQRSRIVLACFALVSVSASAQDLAGQAFRASGRATSQASANTAQAVGASGRATLAVSAIPVAVGGSVLATAGQASAVAAQALVQGASVPPGTPLPVTEEVITVMPPAQALQQSERR